MFDENVWCVYEIQLSTSSFMTSEIWPIYNLPFAHVFLIRRSEKICLQATFFNVFQNNKKKSFEVGGWGQEGVGVTMRKAWKLNVDHFVNGLRLSDMSWQVKVGKVCPFFGKVPALDALLDSTRSPLVTFETLGMKHIW